jgi:hypothetical protein
MYIFWWRCFQLLSRVYYKILHHSIIVVVASVRWLSISSTIRMVYLHHNSTMTGLFTDNLFVQIKKWIWSKRKYHKPWNIWQKSILLLLNID